MVYYTTGAASRDKGEERAESLLLLNLPISGDVARYPITIVLAPLKL